MMIKNKKGILRIIEATIAILIIIGFLLIAQARISDISQPSFSERVYDILEEISKDPVMRGEIFNVVLNSDGKSTVTNGNFFTFVDSRIPESYLKFQIRLCDDIDKICSMESFIDGEIYSGNRIIAPSVDESEMVPRKLAIFVWRINNG